MKDHLWESNMVTYFKWWAKNSCEEETQVETEER